MNYKTQIINIALLFSFYMQSSLAMQDLVDVLILQEIEQKVENERMSSRAKRAAFPKEFEEHLHPHYLRNVPSHAHTIMMHRQGACVSIIYNVAACFAPSDDIEEKVP